MENKDAIILSLISGIVGSIFSYLFFKGDAKKIVEKTADDITESRVQQIVESASGSLAMDKIISKMDAVVRNANIDGIAKTRIDACLNRGWPTLVGNSVDRMVSATSKDVIQKQVKNCVSDRNFERDIRRVIAEEAKDYVLDNADDIIERETKDAVKDYLSDISDTLKGVKVLKDLLD